MSIISAERLKEIFMYDELIGYSDAEFAISTPTENKSVYMGVTLSNEYERAYLEKYFMEIASQTRYIPVVYDVGDVVVDRQLNGLSLNDLYIVEIKPNEIYSIYELDIRVCDVNKLDGDVKVSKFKK